VIRAAVLAGAFLTEQMSEELVQGGDTRLGNLEILWREELCLVHCKPTFQVFSRIGCLEILQAASFIAAHPSHKKN
jgi:hypothetical protein